MQKKTKQVPQKTKAKPAAKTSAKTSAKMPAKGESGVEKFMDAVSPNFAKIRKLGK